MRIIKGIDTPPPAMSKLDMTGLKPAVTEAQAADEAQEDEDLLQEYGEAELEEPVSNGVHTEAAAPAPAPTPASTTSDFKYKKTVLPVSKNRPEKKPAVPLITMNQMALLFGIFLLSLILVVCFREELWESSEENTTLEGDKMKEHGLKETLDFNLQKVERLTLTLQDKAAELKRLKTLLKQKGGG
jgi:hypothetical protein